MRVFFNSNAFYPQTTTAIGAWFVDRYFDQGRVSVELSVSGSENDCQCCVTQSQVHVNMKKCYSQILCGGKILDFVYFVLIWYYGRWQTDSKQEIL